MDQSSEVSQWRILIVDDDDDNLGVATEYLEFMGATVRTACDGVEGLTALQTFSPSIILLDLSMPNIDGWQMLRQLRADKATATIPVIALTAHAMSDDRDRAIAAGFDGYLTKPFVLTTLLEEIGRWIGANSR